MQPPPIRKKLNEKYPYVDIAVVSRDSNLLITFEYLQYDTDNTGNVVPKIGGVPVLRATVYRRYEDAIPTSLLLAITDKLLAWEPHDWVAVKNGCAYTKIKATTKEKTVISVGMHMLRQLRWLVNYKIETGVLDELAVLTPESGKRRPLT